MSWNKDSMKMGVKIKRQLPELSAHRSRQRRHFFIHSADKKARVEELQLRGEHAGIVIKGDGLSQ